MAMAALVITEVEVVAVKTLMTTAEHGQNMEARSSA